MISNAFARTLRTVVPSSTRLQDINFISQRDCCVAHNARNTSHKETQELCMKNDSWRNTVIMIRLCWLDASCMPLYVPLHLTDWCCILYSLKTAWSSAVLFEAARPQVVEVLSAFTAQRKYTIIQKYLWHWQFGYTIYFPLSNSKVLVATVEMIK